MFQWHQCVSRKRRSKSKDDTISDLIWEDLDCLYICNQKILTRLRHVMVHLKGILNNLAWKHNTIYIVCSVWTSMSRERYIYFRHKLYLSSIFGNWKKRISRVGHLIGNYIVVTEVVVDNSRNGIVPSHMHTEDKRKNILNIASADTCLPVPAVSLLCVSSRGQVNPSGQISQ